MNHNVHPSLVGLLTPIEDLEPLANNPNRGNVDAVLAMYRRFGQVKPIVAVLNPETGKHTVIAGNTQMEAAKRDGWTHMAVTIADWDHETATAFAIGDNRSRDLAETDHDVLVEVLAELNEEAALLEALGWDDLELALIEGRSETAIPESVSVPGGGWIPPVLIDLPKTTDEQDDEEDEELEFHGSERETSAAVIQGATAVGQAGSNRVVRQISIVFDDDDQQQDWYKFLRWLKARYPEGTTAKQLIDFIREYTDSLT